MTPWRSRDSRERRAHRAARDVPLETSHVELDAQVRAEIDENYDDYVLIAGYLKAALSAADGEYVEERLRIDSRFHALAEPLEIFGDEVMAAALIDRLVHHCHIVNIRGNSYRMRHHAELRSVLHPRQTIPERSPLKRRSSRQEAPAS